LGAGGRRFESGHPDWSEAYQQLLSLAGEPLCAAIELDSATCGAAQIWMIGNVLDARVHKRIVWLTKGSERASVLAFLVVTVACQELDRQEDRVREAVIREAGAVAQRGEDHR
jgi:hypothetical protein